jgi:hypothetical protein
LPEKGPTGSKICPRKKLGWSTYRFKVVIFDPSATNFWCFLEQKKEDLTGFATQQDTPNTEQYWAISGI